MPAPDSCEAVSACRLTGHSYAVGGMHVTNPRRHRDFLGESMTTFEIVRDLVLLALGLFGAALSIFNYVQAERREKRSVRVVMKTIMPTYFDGSIGAPHIQIEATNVGHRPVAITGISIMTPNGGRLVSMDGSSFPGVPDSALPATLGDGQSAQKTYAYIDVAQALARSGQETKVTLTPVAEDSSGGIHTGTPWEISADDMERNSGPISSR